MESDKLADRACSLVGKQRKLIAVCSASSPDGDRLQDGCGQLCGVPHIDSRCVR
jgi:hypothetical protein